MRRFHPDLLASAALACLTWAVFFPALDGGFVNLDDFTYVSRNRYVTGGLSLEGTRWAFTTYRAANWHPLTWLSLQLDASLWGSEPRGFHRTNVVLHGLNAALVFLVLRRLTGCFWRSAAAALLFAVHPLRVESVAWISERKDVLSIFFGLLALWAYATYARRRSVWRYLLVAVALTVSLLCKPTLVTLPCLLLVLDWWPLARARALISHEDVDSKVPITKIPPRPVHVTWSPQALTRAWFWLVAEKVPLFVIVAASSFITYRAQAAEGAVMDLEDAPPLARVGNAAISYGVYLAKSAWPTQLGALYAHPGSALRVPETIAAALVLAAISLAAVVLRRRAPYLLTGWLWYLGTLVPVIGLVQVGLQAYADRYTYFPQIGLLMALCWGVADLAGSRRRLALSATAAAAGVLAILTVQQIGVWSDSLALWKHTLRTAGESATTYANLAETLENLGRLDEATGYYRDSIRFAPKVVQGHINLGNILQKQNRLDAAAEEFQAIIDLAPDSPKGYTNLGLLRLRQKRFDEAARLLGEACDLRPESEKNEGYVNRALVEEERENFLLAAEYFRMALSVDPTDPKAHAGLGVALLHLGKESEEEGLKELRESVAVDPAFARGYNLLGKALWARNDLEGAAKQFEQETRVSPKPATPWYNLGLIRAIQKQMPEAAECFAKALECDPNSAPCQKALAATLNELRKNGQTNLANQIEHRVLHLMPPR